jgi:membrane protease YdiL (CAAX protease family)
MLFLLKRTWAGALGGLAVLAVVGLGLRFLLGVGPPVQLSWRDFGLGVLVFAGLLGSDGLLHGLFCLFFGEKYRRRYRELAALFRGQSGAAILAGALLAGAGEELVFRGLSTAPAYLIGAAVLFGCLHHVRRRLWPFSVWAGYQGLLLAAAVYFTGALFVTMVAHCLHDLTGFFIFRHVNRTWTE